MEKNRNIVSAKSNRLRKKAVQLLEEDGIVTIRGLFPKEILKKIDKSWNTNFKNPAVSGTIGYHRTSHAKAVLPLFLLGEPALRVALEKKIISIVESFMNSKCTLAEAHAVWHKSTSYTYFPLHSDFAVGWKKSKDSKFELKEKDISFPIGVGAMMYLHDTKSGAFKYSNGSHKLFSRHGQHLKNYPKDIRESINKNITRCEGIKGDLILFDDRGFHGPDQPANEDRSVLLFDYYRNKTFGAVVVTPHYLQITDLSFLDKDQLRVLGMGASKMVRREEYVGARFKHNFFFSFIVWLIEHAYFHKHIKAVSKNKLTKLFIFLKSK